MVFIRNLSVYIPRIHEADANEDFIKHIFFSQEIASVRRIDFSKCMANGKVYYNAKIHFHFWFKNQIAYNIQQRILLSETSGARIVYDDPWYWIVLQNKKPMSEIELAINERLEYVEKNIYKQIKNNKKVKKQIKHLSTQLNQQNQFLDSLHREVYLIIQQNQQQNQQQNDEEATKETAQSCSELVLKDKTPEIRTKCLEVILEEDVNELTLCPACVAEDESYKTYLSTSNPNYIRTLACWGGGCINSNNLNNNVEDDAEIINYDEFKF